MSLAGAMALHEAFGWEPKIDSWRWRLAALAPQIGFLAVWYQRPLWLVIAIGAFLSLTDNIVAWSFYLLLNDKRVLGENRCRSYLWNLGLLLQITLLNSIAIILDALPGMESRPAPPDHAPELHRHHLSVQPTGLVVLMKLDLERRLGPASLRVWLLVMNFGGNAVLLYGAVGLVENGSRLGWLGLGAIVTLGCISALALPSAD